MDVVRLIEESFNEAVEALVMGTSPSALVRARERACVKSLVARLQSAFADEEHRVFAAPLRGNRRDFGQDELLHDILVCRVGRGDAAERQGAAFHYVAEALWQIEIDFSRDWRQAVYAINRLNCGAAASKLLIASAPPARQKRFLDALAAPAAAGQGAFYLALAPHPADWDAEREAPKLWQMTGEWREMT